MTAATIKLGVFRLGVLLYDAFAAVQQNSVSLLD